MAAVRSPPASDEKAADVRSVLDLYIKGLKLYWNPICGRYGEFRRYEARAVSFGVPEHSRIRNTLEPRTLVSPTLKPQREFYHSLRWVSAVRILHDHVKGLRLRERRDEANDIRVRVLPQQLSLA